MSGNDGVDSHSDDEESDEEGNSVTENDDEDGIRSVHIRDGSRGGDQRVNGDDKSGDRIDDGDN